MSTTIVTRINGDDVGKSLRLAVADKQRGEICMFLHRDRNSLCFYNKEHVNVTMCNWRKLRKQGKVEMLECNNHDTCRINGKQFYTLVLQSPNGPMGVDPTGMGWDDDVFLVDGYIYYFRQKNNRDMVYKYVMGIKD
jgi:hypothetical protein